VPEICRHGASIHSSGATGLSRVLIDPHVLALTTQSRGVTLVDRLHVGRETTRSDDGQGSPPNQVRGFENDRCVPHRAFLGPDSDVHACPPGRRKGAQVNMTSLLILKSSLIGELKHPVFKVVVPIADAGLWCSEASPVWLSRVSTLSRGSPYIVNGANNMHDSCTMPTL
jgi:hypothetical protein